jgi:hypothetical protein
MAIDPHESYEKILIANLQRAIDFLKFAEAKNAALLALASAWVVAAINLECSGRIIPGAFALGIPVALLCALCAGLLAMVSFLPQLYLPKFLGGKRAGPHPKNLLYFGDISTLPIKSLEHDLRSRYLPSETSFTEEYIHDLIVQISVNSTIAMRKMRLFRIGIRLIFVAALSLSLAALGVACTVMRGPR